MNGLNALFVIFGLGLTVEAIVETAKLVFVKGHISWAQVAALVTGILLAVTVNIDWLVLLGLDPVIPYVGVVIAGILMSRGGNFAHDLYTKISAGSAAKVMLPGGSNGGE